MTTFISLFYNNKYKHVIYQFCGEFYKELVYLSNNCETLIFDKYNAILKILKRLSNNYRVKMMLLIN